MSNFSKKAAALLFIAFFVAVSFYVTVVPVAHAAVTNITLLTDDNSQTLDTTPLFNFTVSSGTDLTINCTLYVDDVAYGAIEADNATVTCIEANETLAVSDVKKQWYINATDSEGTVKSAVRNIGVGAYFVAPAVLQNPNGTFEHWTYYLNASATNLTATSAVIITGNNITLDGQYCTLDGTLTSDTDGITFNRDYEVQYTRREDPTDVIVANLTLTEWYRAVRSYYASNSTFYSLVLANCSFYGIRFNYSTDHTLYNITSYGHDSDTFFLYNTTNTVMYNLTSYDTQYGLILSYSNSNRLSDSKIFGCSENGIRISNNSTENGIYNNLFNNTINLYYGTAYLVPNYLNTTKQEGTRIYSEGPYIGGNFWAKPDGTGISETGVDLDKDGFIDTPYTADTQHIDYLPLSSQYEEPTEPTPTSEPVTPKKTPEPETTPEPKKPFIDEKTMLYIAILILLAIAAGILIAVTWK